MFHSVLKLFAVLPVKTASYRLVLVQYNHLFKGNSFSMTRTVLITGTSSGIGLETVLGIAKSDPECNFILINRNIESTQKSICHLRAHVPDINILKCVRLLANQRASISWRAP